MEYGLVVLWLAAYAWLAVAGLPVAAALLRRLPGRGAGLALPLSLAVVWVVALGVAYRYTVTPPSDETVLSASVLSGREDT